jgi:two-component system, OmpR family, sensor kinase
VTLRLRLLLVLVGIVAVGLIVSDVVTYKSLQSFLEGRLEQQLRTAPGAVAHALQICEGEPTVNGPFSSSQCSLPADTNVLPGTYGQLRNANDGSIILSACFNSHTARAADVPSPLPVAANPRNATVFTVTNTGCGASSYAGVATQVGVNPFQDVIVVVALPRTEEDQTLGRLLLIETLVSIVVLAGLAGLSWWVVRRALRPLDEMATTAGAIASGDLSQRVAHTEAHTEVGRLGVALNTMLGEIETAFAARSASEERLRRFLADASHELRTPLTSIRGYAEIFDRGARDRPEDLATSMRHISTEAHRMSELVDDLLLLARVDRERPLAHEVVDLTEVAAASVGAARVQAPGRAIGYRPAGPVVVSGDASRLRQVVDNLMANAIAHTPAGTPIEVEVGRHGSEALLTVTDHGPGIAPADRDHIFEPFHRADPSRARATGGVGLGLAIVSAIATAHGGTVGVDSTEGSGASFWVRLPLAPASAPSETAAGAPPPAPSWAPPPTGPPELLPPPPASNGGPPTGVGAERPPGAPGGDQPY